MATPKNLPEGIKVLKIKKWKNKHENFTQDLKKNASFKLTWPSSKKTNAEKYHATTKNFQWLIKYAIKNKIRLRAMGSGWSFSKVGVTEGGIIDTKSLRLAFGIKKDKAAQSYLDKGKNARNLFLVQCGMSMLQLNKKMERGSLKRSLKASGASNGQTIVGAMSTGTHGSAFKVGSVQDFVVGLHLVTGPDQHVWIERKSYPVTNQAFAEWIGAEVIRDDAIFNSALVSFGSFGFIHGVMIETEPIFLLEKYNLKLSYDNQLKAIMDTCDLTRMKKIIPRYIKRDINDLYHFQVIFNPHDMPGKKMYVGLMYKGPYDKNYVHEHKMKEGFTYGDSLTGVIQTIIDAAGGIIRPFIPKLTTLFFGQAYKQEEKKKGKFATVGDMFGATNTRGTLASMAIAVDASDCTRALKLILDFNKKCPFPGGIGVRYLKGSQATLGFTKFDLTCVIELDGLDCDIARKFYEDFYEILEKEKIKFTLHWGKFNYMLNKGRVRKMFGGKRMNEWVRSRHALLDHKTREVFANKFIEKCGLHISAIT